LAAAWLYWWHLPPRPIRTRFAQEATFDGFTDESGANIAKDGRTVFQVKNDRQWSQVGPDIISASRVDIETGLEEPLFTGKRIWSYQFSTDGCFFALIDEQGRIEIVESITGRLVVRKTAVSDHCSNRYPLSMVRALPDGRTFAVRYDEKSKRWHFVDA